MAATEDVTRCAELVRRGDPERFATAMTAPPGPERDALMVLYAFNLEVARAPYVTTEPMIARMRLQWWADVLDEIAAGGPVRRHEVATPLGALVARTGISVGPLREIVAARAWDVERAPFEDDAALIAHLEHTGGTLMRAAAEATGGAAETGALFGAGAAAANWLRAVPALIAAGRTPLPRSDEDSVRDLARWGLARMASARELSRGAKAARGMAALRAGYLAEPVLRRVMRSPGAVLDGTLEPSEFYKRMRLLVLTLAGRF